MALANNGLELDAGPNEVFRVFFVVEIHWLRLAVLACKAQSSRYRWFCLFKGLRSDRESKNSISYQSKTFRNLFKIFKLPF
jgi:hypothetical protein